MILLKQVPISYSKSLCLLSGLCMLTIRITDKSHCIVAASKMKQPPRPVMLTLLVLSILTRIGLLLSPSYCKESHLTDGSPFFLLFRQRVECLNLHGGFLFTHYIPNSPLRKNWLSSYDPVVEIIQGEDHWSAEVCSPSKIARLCNTAPHWPPAWLHIS